MPRSKLEVADIFRRHGDAYRQKHDASLSTVQRRVMTAIELCRTAALGGHVEQCDHCGCQRISYNSCRNRHCPKCQSLARARWLDDRRSEVLDTEYFHVVFTMPKELAAIAYQNKELVYGILFRAAADTLRIIAADPKHLGAEIGFFAVLHTWGQNLLHHPHLHCVILSCLFRRLFLEYLTAAFDAGKLKFFHTLEPLWQRRAFLRTLAPLWNAKWVVHAKRPFAGPEQVLDYVGRYTHRVAISNNRLESMDDANVSFRWKDYRDNNKQKTMTLTGEEFIRRFLLHVVPRGFQRIRYYGFLANSCREQKLARCRELLANQKPPAPSDEPPAPEPTKDYRDQYQRLTGASLRECPACHHGIMIVIGAVKPVPRPVPFPDTS